MFNLAQGLPDIQNSLSELRIIVPAYRSIQNILIAINGFAILLIWMFYFNVPFFEPTQIISWIFVFISFGVGTTLLLWTLFGKEELIIDSKEIKLKKTIFGLGKTKVFERRNIKEFTANYASVKDLSNRKSVLFGGGIGRIRFFVNNKMYTLGLSLSPNQLENILQIINVRINGHS